MKKIQFLIALLLITFSINAQDTATVKVKVINENQELLEGEQVMFESQNDASISFKGVTNAEGTFDIKLIGGVIYDVKLKTVGDAENYNTLEIPALEPGHKYGVYLYTFTIYEPKIFTLDNVYFDSGKSILKSEFVTTNSIFCIILLFSTVRSFIL